MNYRKDNTLAYNVHFVKTDRFKNVGIRINFKQKLTKEEITKRNLLVNILFESTKNYPTRRLVDIRREELYDVGFGVNTTMSGKYNIMSFNAFFLNDKYTEPNNLEESLKFFLEFIFNPNVVDNKFDKKTFNNAKNVLENDIKQFDDNPTVYSKYRCLSEMNKGGILSYKSVGYLEDLKKLDEKDIYEYYKEVIKKDIVDIFVIGDFDQKVFKDVFDKYLMINTVKKQSEPHYFEHQKIKTKSRTIKEKKDYEQSTLVLGFKLDKLTDFEKKYVSIIYNYILGGGADSKLFKEVREKNSLCYGISSSISVVNNTMMITAGIDANQYKKATKIIKQVLKDMTLGNFKDEDIEAGKKTYLSSFKELEDSISAIINLYASYEYLNFDLLELRKKEILKVTKSMIVNFSKKINLDTIFLLEGGSNEEDTSN
ncbi:MAG: pitrilysin family protein [Bacilli bacterium]|nr:pitrilysin family protein [Bacilli bacterium]MDD4733904.1 pitrilysin family protein [Bacilli bacterium]